MKPESGLNGSNSLGEGSFGYVVAAKDLVAGKRVAIKKITRQRIHRIGSFGYVVAAKDLVAGKRVAIKKIKDALEDEIDGKRLLRELKFLRHCRGHENFIIIKARAHPTRGYPREQNECRL
ncbi:hypothetical protein T484DRAFT_1798655 [Baffinella frigidus]|nr:hypothetical protein T484DRAFT_1798655 [Cryptophyta sp. CCMP2293]